MDWKKITEKIKAGKTDKTGFLLLILAGVLLLVIALPVKSPKTEQAGAQEEKEAQTADTAELSADSRTTERRLEQILSKIDGAGRVKVMLTYRDSGTQIVEKDDDSSKSSTKEGDGANAHETEESQRKETTVYGNDGTEPFVARELTPEIEGVLVVAQGGDKASVRQNISNAVLALFPIEVHKIVVVKMND